jgi:hypothetical protein
MSVLREIINAISQVHSLNVEIPSLSLGQILKMHMNLAK